MSRRSKRNLPDPNYTDYSDEQIQELAEVEDSRSEPDSEIIIMGNKDEEMQAQISEMRAVVINMANIGGQCNDISHLP